MLRPAPDVRLLHGARMPQLGLGTWPMDDAEAERAVANAIELGYRLIDTAENYGNERGVGRGLRASGLPRNEAFVTTKFNRRWHGRSLAVHACEQSLERLGLDYLDLLLIHWPNPDQGRYADAWEGLADLLEHGTVKAIGTSNFTPAHLETIIERTGVVPDVNQVQLTPHLTRAEIRKYGKERGIVIESWSPLGRQDPALFEEPLIIALAQQYGRTPAQIILRWHIELDLVAIPKSGDPRRQRENLAIFDFALTADEVAELNALDKGPDQPGVPDPEVFGH